MHPLKKQKLYRVCAPDRELFNPVLASDAP